MRKRLLSKKRLNNLSQRVSGTTNFFIFIILGSVSAMFLGVFLAIIFSSFAAFLVGGLIAIIGSYIWCYNLNIRPTIYDNIIVTEDLLVDIALVSKDDRKYVYYSFDGLNKYHKYGWVLPTEGNLRGRKEEYYIIKDGASNRILFTAEKRLYELDDELKSLFVPMQDLYINPCNKKGEHLDETSYVQFYSPRI